MKDIASILWGCVREVKYSINEQCCERIEVLDNINDEIVLLIYDSIAQ